MNKREALRACLDGKRVTHPRLGGAGPIRYDTYQGGEALVRADGIPMSLPWLPADDHYALYVEPPKEVTRAEAWAALDEGKLVRVDMQFSDYTYFRSDFGDGLHALQYSVDLKVWSEVHGLWRSNAGSPGAKFYIVEAP